MYIKGARKISSGSAEVTDFDWFWALKVLSGAYTRRDTRHDTRHDTHRDTRRDTHRDTRHDTRRDNRRDTRRL